MPSFEGYWEILNEDGYDYKSMRDVILEYVVDQGKKKMEYVQYANEIDIPW